MSGSIYRGRNSCVQFTTFSFGHGMLRAAPSTHLNKLRNVAWTPPHQAFNYTWTTCRLWICLQPWRNIYIHLHFTRSLGMLGSKRTHSKLATHAAAGKDTARSQISGKKLHFFSQTWKADWCATIRLCQFLNPIGQRTSVADWILTFGVSERP